MSDPRTALVGAGYDAMADTWEAWSSSIDGRPASGLAAAPRRAASRRRARCVELGCGNGTRETRELARRFHLTGVDLSEEQLRRARERVPGASSCTAT